MISLQTQDIRFWIRIRFWPCEPNATLIFSLFLVSHFFPSYFLLWFNTLTQTFVVVHVQGWPTVFRCFWILTLSFHGTRPTNSFTWSLLWQFLLVIPFFLYFPYLVRIDYVFTFTEQPISNWILRDFTLSLKGLVWDPPFSLVMISWLEFSSKMQIVAFRYQHGFPFWSCMICHYVQWSRKSNKSPGIFIPELNPSWHTIHFLCCPS